MSIGMGPFAIAFAHGQGSFRATSAGSNLRRRLGRPHADLDCVNGNCEDA